MALAMTLPTPGPADSAPPADSAWKVTAYGSRSAIQAALIAHEDAEDWDPEIVLSGFEIADDRPEDWVIEAWLDHEPTADDLAALAALFESPPPFVVEALPDADWVTESQKGLPPIRAGRFLVVTPEADTGDAPGLRRFVIPASRAFGTGHHATTAGCLEMLTRMRESGVLVRNAADIGTGTGLLAFAALELWPRAHVIASDIDHVCAPLVLDNAEANGVTLGAGPGTLTMVVAAGMDDALLAARGPYDLLIANILAGPLVELAPDFGRAVVPGGHLVLSGLLATQEAEVRAAMFRSGMRLAARAQYGDWSVLWLRKRPLHALRTSLTPRWARV